MLAARETSVSLVLLIFQLESSENTTQQQYIPPFLTPNPGAVVDIIPQYTESCGSTFAMASSSSNVVGVHYRVGKKIGEGSFGVIFEGTNLLNNQQVAIKFVGANGRFLAPFFADRT